MLKHLSGRQKLAMIPLLLYWPAIFILTHIPLPGELLKDICASDKTFHYIMYLILAFLLWFTINPEKKVNWLKGSVWVAMCTVVVYAALDEWLQGFVNRNPDVFDFLADLAGAISGFILLSIFPFWPASLVLTAAIIFAFTNYFQNVPSSETPLLNTLIHIITYSVFSLLWIKYMPQHLPLKAPQPKWLIGALAMPIALLLVIESFSAFAGRGFNLESIIFSLASIAITVTTIIVWVLLRESLSSR